MDGEYLRRAPRWHQQRMRRVGNVHVSDEHFHRWPLESMPSVIQNANRNASIDYARAGFDGDARCGTIFPGAGKEENVVAVNRCIGAYQLMNVLADAGTLAQGGPVVDEDAHNGRVQLQATETQNR
jgi:hypothetical protein